jgi:hypothetical protein
MRFAILVVLALAAWLGSVPVAAQPDVPPPADTVTDAAIAAAADRLQVSTDRLVVVATEARDWSDSSLGCPEPGRAYAQVIIEGYLVTIGSADGDEVLVHADESGRQVAIC